LHLFSCCSFSHYGTYKTLAVIRGFHTTAVSLVKFSANGKLLVSVASNEINGIAVYKWATGVQVAALPSHCARLFMAAFRPEANDQVCLQFSVSQL
jgi:hypothetical protein